MRLRQGQRTKRADDDDDAHSSSIGGQLKLLAAGELSIRLGESRGNKLSSTRS